MSIAKESCRDWDEPLLPGEEGLGQCGNAGAYVSEKLQKDFSIHEIMLTPEELATVGARLQLNSSVITVAPAEVFFGDDYAQQMLLVAAQKLSNPEDDSVDGGSINAIGHEL